MKILTLYTLLSHRRFWFESLCPKPFFHYYWRLFWHKLSTASWLRWTWCWFVCIHSLWKKPYQTSKGSFHWSAAWNIVRKIWHINGLFRNEIDPQILRSFCLYTPPFETFFASTHPFWDKVFASTHPFWDKALAYTHPFWVLAFTHPKKLYLVRSIIVPPQQEKEQRFLLPDLSAAPQIKKVSRLF